MAAASTRRRQLGLAVVGLLWLCAGCAGGGAVAEAPAGRPPIYVILWFDTEDYILPASDDAALKLADFLTREKIRATFKVVGEKARTLERRGRRDVIEALKKHEIGYHSNFHSVQPSQAMYLSDLGWDEGVAEFDRRERPGYDDVARIFGTAPSCYGQPGSSWGPQSFGAMRRWGMPVYLDSGQHVRLDDKPHYYGGILTMYRLAHTPRTLLTGPADLDAAIAKFRESREKLTAEGGGIVSIVYHPCEFVHKEFWDGANFKGGANPPREKWKLPAAKTAEETKIAFETFEGYVKFMKSFPEVRFITALEAAKLYKDKAAGRKFGPAELKAIAAEVGEGVTFVRRGDAALSPAEVFALLNAYVAAGKPGEGAELTASPFGPSGAPPAAGSEPVTTDWSQFTRTAADVQDYLTKRGRIPTSVWLGGRNVSPESYLRALAEVTLAMADGQTPPETIELKPAKLAAADYVSEDIPKLWGWVIFPKGFMAPAMMELAKRQAWTIKPAIRDDSALK